MPGILSLSRDSVAYVVIVALAVSLACSVVVTAAAVYLKPAQVANAKADRRQNILDVAELMAPGVDINQIFRERIETRVVNLQTGEYTEDIDAAKFDQRDAARDPSMSVNIPAEHDLADIKRRSKYAQVYLVRDEAGAIESIVLPFHGKGLWSTMYGFVAVSPNGGTIQGLKFYEHGETPGLGGEVDNPKWQAQWEGKKIYGEDGEPEIGLIKGAVDQNTKNAQYKIDGLSGATLTSNGVTNMVRYWLSERGFKPYLQRISEQPLSAQG